MISEMYKGKEEKKDGAYTIFYMGVNAGAFFGMMLCGYLAETYGWSYGFGLAGIFMMLGMLQFWRAKNLFGSIGAKPSEIHEVELPQNINEESPAEQEEAEANEKLNPFTMFDKVLMIFAAVGGLLYLFNDPLEKIGGINMLPFEFIGLSGNNVVFGLSRTGAIPGSFDHQDLKIYSSGSRSDYSCFNIWSLHRILLFIL